MTTTITREERERVADLLGYPDWATAIGEIGFSGIDRVAQALRDAEGETLRKVVDHLGGDVMGKKTATMADVMEIVEVHEDRARQAAAPQWREVTETEPARDATMQLLCWGPGLPGACLAIRRAHGSWLVSDGSCVKPTHWMPLPAPPEAKPAPAPAPRPIAQPGASEAARIDALERTVTEIALAVERLSGGAK